MHSFLMVLLGGTLGGQIVICIMVWVMSRDKYIQLEEKPDVISRLLAYALSLLNVLRWLSLTLCVITLLAAIISYFVKG